MCVRPCSALLLAEKPYYMASQVQNAGGGGIPIKALTPRHLFPVLATSFNPPADSKPIFPGYLSVVINFQVKIYKGDVKKHFSYHGNAIQPQNMIHYITIKGQVMIFGAYCT